MVALAVLGKQLGSMVLEVLSNLNDSIPAANSELFQLTEQILWKHYRSSGSTNPAPCRSRQLAP